MNEPSGGVARTAPAHASLRVLLIDDQAFVLQAIRNLLEVDGHLVSAAESGSAGLEMFGAALAGGMPFDVVFTDFGMPEMDGGEVARRVKLASPMTWVVLLTGGGPAVDASEGWKGQVDAFLAKPPRLADLRRVLAAVHVQ